MTPFPNKKYQTIYIDPPWRYNAKNPTCKIEKQPRTCSVEYYYQTMKIKDIKNLPIKDISDTDCVLFLWVTTPLLDKGFEVIKAWEFKYKTTITWGKTNNDCMGYWFRVCTEHLLVGIKGNVKAFRSMERTLREEPRLSHSRKPQYFRNLISSIRTGSKIELFARPPKDKLFEDKSYEGWDLWGNEC